MLLDTPAAEIGWKAQAFTLADADGKQFSFSELEGPKGLLIGFICNHCPYVQAIIERLVTDFAVLQSEGVGVVAISSNDYESFPADSPEKMKQLAERYGFSFPYLVDADQSVAKTYGAVCTPDFFGFNTDGELQYRGRLDDKGMDNPQNRQTELLNAMRQIANTGKGPNTQYPSMGCSIKWRR